ncbi:MAG: PbpA [Deltaproteobacteria bacterium]|nr:PbpA [Deltaproteobacteria bacterium]
MNKPTTNNSTWRDYQAGLRRSSAKKRFKKKVIIYSPLLSVLLAVIYAAIAGMSGAACKHNLPRYNSTIARDSEKVEQNNFIKKEEIQLALNKTPFINLTTDKLDITISGQTLHADTSLDMKLQNHILKRLDLANSRYIGIVALEPSTGRVLAMVGFDRTGQKENPCIESSFPAASIFKIVTASAGIEKCGFSPSTGFKFNGSKYTLYKSQLRNKTNRYTRRINLQDSFAQSVNPVFGKIGSIYLGKAPLEHYAGIFGFNHNTDFEIPLNPSRVSFTDDAYQWAEIACGFNRETSISPVHGALMSAVICNGGAFVEPTIIDNITDNAGNIRYARKHKKAGQVLLPETASVVGKLMNATVRSGTAKKMFRGYTRDKILSKLNIGGKTGSIMSRKINNVRYDWFVGFAKEKNGENELALSVMVAHEKYIGARAGWYARIAMQHYFKNCLEDNNKKNQLVKKSQTTKKKPT